MWSFGQPSTPDGPTLGTPNTFIFAFGQLGLTGGPIRPDEALGQGNPAWRHDPQCHEARPVNCATGNFWHRFIDLEIPGRGPGLVVDRTYNALDAATAGPFGHGWSSLLGMGLTSNPGGSVTVTQENGSRITFTASAGGTFATLPRLQARLTPTSEGYEFVRHDRETFVFGPGGELLVVRDLNGWETSFSYDATGHLTSVIDSSNRTLIIDTDEAGRITSITDPAGRSVTYSYDSVGNLGSVTDVGGGVSTFAYDSAHRLTAWTEPGGGVTTNAYDSEGRVVAQTDPTGAVTTFEYSASTTTITRPDGAVLHHVYLDGALVSLTKGVGTAHEATWSYSYDPDTLGRTASTDPNGNTTSATYDDDGNPLTVTDPLGHTSSFSYGPHGEVTSMTNPAGHATVLDYDSAANLLAVRRTLDTTGETAEQTYGYDPARPGDLVRVTDPTGRSVTLSYDLHGNLATVRDAAANTTRFTYDSVGRRLTTSTSAGTDPSGVPLWRTTSVVHNAFGDVTTITDPLGAVVTRAYDPDRHLIASTDPDGNLSAYDRDEVGRVLTETRPDGSTIATSYDAMGRVLTTTDAAGNVTTYSYDALGRRATMTDPLNRTTSYLHDRAGNLVGVVDPAGQTTTRTYDAADRLTAVDYSDGTTASVTYTYDANGRRTGTTDATGASTYTWDSLDRLTAVTDGHGQSLTYLYDLAGRTTAIGYPNGETVTRSYDTAGRWVGVTDWLSNTSTFAYGPDGNLVGGTFGNGTATSYDHDDAGRLAGIQHTTGGDVLAAYDYTREPSGLLASAVTVGLSPGREDYGYSPLNHLTQVNDRSYAYDEADNLTVLGDGTVQRFDAGAQLLTATRPITVVGTATAFNNTSATMNLALPDTVRADDQILLFVTMRGAQSLANDPAGYTYVAQRSATDGARVYVFRRTATGAERNVSVNFSDLGLYAKTLMAVVYRGVDPDQPIDTFASHQTGAPSNTITVDSITTSRPGARLVMVQGANGNLLPETFTQPVGMMPRVDQSNQSTITTAVADQELPGAGATGSRTATYSSSSVQLVGIMLALNPARATFDYDSRGNRIRTTDIGGTTTTYGYDQANQLTDVNGTLTYTYDADGLRASTQDPSGATAFVWDRTPGLPLMLSETPLDAQGQPRIDQASFSIYGPGGRVLTRIDPRPSIQIIGTQLVSEVK